MRHMNDNTLLNEYFVKRKFHSLYNYHFIRKTKNKIKNDLIFQKHKINKGLENNIQKKQNTTTKTNFLSYKKKIII